jgi:bacteriocin-like protein
MSNERELTNDELDAVSGGALGYIEARFPTATGGGGGGGGGGATTPAGAWNACLGVFGYGPQA